MDTTALKVTCSVRKKLRCYHQLFTQCCSQFQGRIQYFKLRGVHLKKCTERRGVWKFLGYFVWKITVLCQKILFFPILVGGRATGAPPWIRSWNVLFLLCSYPISAPPWTNEHIAPGKLLASNTEAKILQRKT
jgi:hypothetical protein